MTDTNNPDNPSPLLRFYAYAKNVAADLSQEQLRRLAAVMEAEVRDE